MIINKKISNLGVQYIKRFESNIGKTARSLNQTAIRELKSDKIIFTYPKATVEDLKRLTSKTIEDSYKRVTWTNPKNGKIYHILETGREKGLVNVRILNQDGQFLKEAQLKPKTIVIFDQFKSLKPRTLTHGEIVETYLKRTNPFANIERLSHKKNLYEMIKYRGDLPVTLQNKRFEELLNKMYKGKNVDYLSITECGTVDIGQAATKSGHLQKAVLTSNWSKDSNMLNTNKLLRCIIAKGVRVIQAAGNTLENVKSTITTTLGISGVEGVGSLSKTGKVARDSASRNSIFTQHYEARNYKGTLVEENGKILGINITGKSGTDLPYNKKTKSLLRNIGGTSYSTPVRVGKLSLNDMLQGIL